MGNITAKAKILIVEDDTPLACWMVSILTHAGCDVEAARSGKRAMELAAENQFDVITLDIRLPDINGFLICKELKQRHISRKTPVIFVSASPFQADRQQSLKLGAVDYIEKPFKANDFVARLLSHVEKALPRADSPFDEEFP